MKGDEYRQVTLRTTVIVNEAMRQEMKRLRQQLWRERLKDIGCIALAFAIPLIAWALIILSQKIK